MASLQKKADAWYGQFIFAGRRHTVGIGKVSATEANRWKANAENLLQLLQQGRLQIPRGCGIHDFILHDGKPPTDPELTVHKETTLGQLREAYINTFSNGAIEKNTLYTAGIHLDHMETTLGKGFILSGLTLGKLQSHINRRTKDVVPITIKKELDTFRSAWNWGLRMKWVDHPFPSAGLVYSKTDEKLPFMTWQEVERRIKSGGDVETLWEGLYLQEPELTELLAHVKQRKSQPWVYPAVAMAAHTGARKSEIIRCRIEDIDLTNSVLTIREKKRAQGVRTTRRVPISTVLAGALTPFMEQQTSATYLLGEGDTPLSVQAVHQGLARALKGSRWSVIKGWHTLRHSFISACACRGLDQRFIDEWVGHQTEQQKMRYRHLYPSVQAAALKSVFG